MDTRSVNKKIRNLNMIIQRSVKSEPEGDVITLISLSAIGTIYLRNNNIEKLESIEKEIDEALNNYGKYLIELKLPA